jgi:hypothetical protein
MGIVLAVGNDLTLLIKRSRILLFAIVIATVGFVAPAGDANTVFASQVGTLSVSPSHTDLASTVTATVFDPDLNLTVLREFETQDSTGNLYELPIGPLGTATVFKLQNAAVADFNADGSVTAADLQISTSKAIVQWVNKDSGTFQVAHIETVSVKENFTVTYRSEHNDTTTVTLRTASDLLGFTLTLRETTPTSHTFSATFKTGAATVVTGATDATAVTRPVIKVADGDTITLEYADASPAKLISEAVVVDATKPSVSITSPTHNSSTSNSTAWANVIVTDAASGVDLSQIRFHVDIDRDEIFDEAGEIITASAANSVAINQGWNAVALLPAVASDGLVNWYVTATDRASNVGQSDSEATAGIQFHKYTADTSPPSLLEVVLGQAHDAALANSDNTIVGNTASNVLNSVKVKWSEPIKESLIDASRFFIDGEAALTATMVTNIKDTVWLTFEDIPTTPKLLTIMPGAVSDLTEFPNDLKELIPIDKLGPRLTVSTDTAITNGLLTIKVTTVETLTDDPTVTINGVTFGSAQPVGTNEWAIAVDGTTFTGAAAGDGVKNVEAAGFDASLNIARGGLAVEAATYPTGAVQFHLDTVIKNPIIVPGDREVSIVPRPLITVSFAEEIGEYSGDTHAGVTIISAKLDGVDVTSGFTAESASTWSYRPGDLKNTQHTLEVVGRDDAGNTHSPIVRVFSVLAPEATATPVPTETPIPTPTVELPPAVAPTEIPTDASDVAPADPEPVENPIDTETPVDPETEDEVPVETVPEPDSDVDPEVVVPPSDTEEPAPADDTTTDDTTADPEQVPEPDDTGDAADDTGDVVDDPEAPAGDTETPAEDDAAEEVTDDAEVTEDDIAATVAAMRADDELDDATEDDPSLAPEPALTVFGCNVPTGPEEAKGAVIAGGDYLIMVAGLFGLIVARARPKRRKSEKQL